MNFYEERLIDKFTIERKFTHSPGDEFPWHRDSEDRKIIIIDCGDGWCYQTDNCLPEILKPNKVIQINKNTFHRLLGGNESLVIHIIKERGTVR